MKVVRREVMLAVSPLKNERESEGFDGGNLLESIDFDEIFAGMPDLKMDCENLAEFSGSDSGSAATDSLSDITLESTSGILTKAEEPEPAARKGDSKESLRSRNTPAGKKKAKVDWTPELHRRFVTAVDQLGIDKAVPSRILEIMGINCLTRHNIASHLQKYRSHRKHLLAREAGAVNWSRRRHMYGTAAAQADLNPWIAPTTGFPPVAPAPHFRPLQVWGHPSVDQSLMYTWPKHIAPPYTWPPPPSPLADPSFWHHHHQYVPPPTTLYWPPQFPPARLSQSPAGDVPAAQKKLSQTPSNVYPSKESIDAAIGDVLAKEWLPLPLGLKPPSINGVMVELQRQGVSKIPPT